MDWNAIIIAVLSSGTVTTMFIKWLEYRNKKKDCRDERQKARDTLLVYLAAARQIEIMQKCLAENSICISDFNYCTEVYSAYKSLGGNHLVDELWNKCKTLEITDK
jgi:hypothetical protein